MMLSGRVDGIGPTFNTTTRSKLSTEKRNVDNDTLRRVLDNPEAMAAVERIEGWRSLGDNIIETIINKSEKVKELKNLAKDKDLTANQKKQLTDEEKEYKSKRKLVQEKLIKFATRIPAFMYLTDFRENTLQDVITKPEPDLFLAVTGLTVKDFHLLVRRRVFNTEQMNQAVFAFRRYEDALAPLHGNREPRGPDPLWALRHRSGEGVKGGRSGSSCGHEPTLAQAPSERRSVPAGRGSQTAGHPPGAVRQGRHVHRVELRVARAAGARQAPATAPLNHRPVSTQ
jgi:hypothetical protein